MRSILGDPGADSGGENLCFSGTNQKSERRRPFGTGLVRHCPQGLFSPFFTFLRAVFFRPFRLSLAPTIWPLGLRGCVWPVDTNSNRTNHKLHKKLANQKRRHMSLRQTKDCLNHSVRKTVMRKLKASGVTAWIIERLDRKLADAIGSNRVEKCDVTLSRAIQPFTSDVLRVFN